MGYINEKEHNDLIHRVLDAERERDGFRARVTELEREMSAHDEAATAAEQDRAEIVAERDALLKVLLDAEWVEWVPGNGEAQCPSCMAFASVDVNAEGISYNGKHHKDCELAAAILLVRGGTNV